MRVLMVDDGEVAVRASIHRAVVRHGNKASLAADRNPAVLQVAAGRPVAALGLGCVLREQP